MIPKFRAYIIDSSSPINNRMVNFDEFEIMNFQSKFLTFSTGLWSLDHLHLMQWTGYKDKNDKDIYDGDLVVKNFEGFVGITTTEIFRVKFVDGCWVLKDLEEECPISTFDELLDDACSAQFLEVIGNIYENPELLKESNDE